MCTSFITDITHTLKHLTLPVPSFRWQVTSWGDHGVPKAWRNTEFSTKKHSFGAGLKVNLGEKHGVASRIVQTPVNATSATCLWWILWTKMWTSIVSSSQKRHLQQKLSLNMEPWNFFSPTWPLKIKLVLIKTSGISSPATAGIPQHWWSDRKPSPRAGKSRPPVAYATYRSSAEPRRSPAGVSKIPWWFNHSDRNASTWKWCFWLLETPRSLGK